MSAIIVTGTDTEIGKTVFSAALTGALGASYWKPVQAGTDEEGHGDAETVSALSGRPVLPSAYRLKTPCSPHLAETTGVVAETLRSRDDVVQLDARSVVTDLAESPIDLADGDDGHVQLWPHRDGTDAMFRAVLRRV